MSEATPSLAYVRASIRELPGHLSAAAKVALPPCARPSTIVTSGIGASEGPARVLASTLSEAGLAARFCPMSAFVASPPRGDLLVLFSQGLSPNARLALAAAERFATRWLVTSVDPGRAGAEKRAVLEIFLARGFTPIGVPPRDEPNTLVRLVGPTVATQIALRLAAHLSGDARLRACAAVAAESYRTCVTPCALDGPLALVTIGVSPEQAYAHRWKLLEALLLDDPPVWDVLQFAHGALQAYHGRALRLLVLERGHGSGLFSRFISTLDSTRHQVVHVGSERVDELCFFEHAAAIDALILRTLEVRPLDLFNWPARQEDAPLYGLGG